MLEFVAGSKGNIRHKVGNSKTIGKIGGGFSISRVVEIIVID
jgi:hypothetical protein